MARKKTTRKKKGNAIPRGFTAISSLGKSWPNAETEEGESVQGVVIGYKRDIDTQYGPNDIIIIETKDGDEVEIWKSTVLEPLFEEDYEEYEVFIQFDGLGEAKGNQSPPKLFTLAYKE